MNINIILYIAQAICLVATGVLILLQNRSSGLSASFGGDNQVYLTRRGVEKSVVNFTVVFLVLFVILRIVHLFIV